MEGGSQGGRGNERASEQKLLSVDSSPKQTPVMAAPEPV